MQTKIRFGIIGCSSIAAKSAIPAICDTPNAELKMIASRSLLKAKKFAKKFSCDLYGSYDEILERNDIDAVYISLPIGLHEKWVVKSARAGKHVLCEKSSTSSYKSAKNMVKECKKNNVRLLEGFSFRFHPQHNVALEIIQKNLLGKPILFSSHYGFQLPYSNSNIRFQKKLAGGALNDVGCYPICASRIILQNKPSSILCYLDFEERSDVDINGSILIQYADKSKSFLAFGFNMYFQSTYSLWGSSGILNLERAFNAPSDVTQFVTLQSQNKKRDKIRNFRVKPSNQFKLMFNDFCKVLKNSKVEQFSYENDLLDQAQIMEAARESHRRRRSIHINEI